MAEFQEVARHWKRMCKKYWTATSCHGCPIAEYERGYEACSAYEADVAKMEELVMSWAAKHPEPKFPTWGEYLCDIGLIGDCTEAEDVVLRLFNNTISPDTAEKLGVKPIEPKE